MVLKLVGGKERVMTFGGKFVGLRYTQIVFTAEDKAGARELLGRSNGELILVHYMRMLLGGLREG